MNINSFISNGTTIGTAIQEIMAYPSLLTWDNRIEKMYHDSYVPSLYEPSTWKGNEGSLYQVYSGYMNHNGFDLNFFPSNITDDSKVSYVANLINLYHDFVHAICEYESSDEDEMRLESFLLGNNPYGFAYFFDNCFRSPEINSKKYKHLRDVWEAEVFVDDFKRGQIAKHIFSYKLEELEHIDIYEVRRMLNVNPRTSFRAYSNSCGLRTVSDFFRGSEIRSNFDAS